MIYCPECGTANRNGSTFCNECGQKLDAFARIKCPQCGAMNSVQDASCSECGARLWPADDGPTPKGLFLPRKGLTWGEEEEATGEETVDLEEEEGAALEEPADLEDRAPAWLRELEAQWLAESGAPAGSASEGQDRPEDRLRDLPLPLPDAHKAESPEESEAPKRSAAVGPLAGANEKNEEIPLAGAEEEGVPRWLAELQEAAGAEVEEREDLPEGGEGEAPDWLAELQDAVGARIEEPESPLATEGEAPDWLMELHNAAKAKPAEDKVPDRLAGMPPREIEVSRTVESEPPVPVTTREWGEVPEPMAKAEIPESPDADGECSDWTAEMETEEPEPATVLEEQALDRPAEMPLSTGTEIERGAVLEAERREPPDWLAEMGDLLEEGPQRGSEPTVPDEKAGALDGPRPAERDQGDSLVRAEIPGWLLERKLAEPGEEGESRAFGPVAIEPTEETGLLAGLPDVLPVERLIAQPRSASKSELLEPLLTGDAPQVRLFTEVVSHPPQVEPQALEQPRQQQLGVLPRSLIFLALIAVVTVPLFLAEPLWPRNPVAGPPVQDLYEEIELINEGALVLVAFDYDPSTSDEMNALAQILVDHLMERGAGIVAVSLYPAGPPVAQAMLDELAAQHPNYADAYGQRYVNFGYLPGQATAVRLLAQSLPVALPRDFQTTLLADLPLLDGIVSIQDFALILELAASEQSVRWWIEQAATPYHVPLASGVSASVVPFVQPYYQTEPRQLVGLAGGLPDAAAYATLRGDLEAQEGALAARLDSLTGGHLVFIMVLAIGSVVQFLRRRRGGR
jgi:hypothetical protein